MAAPPPPPVPGVPGVPGVPAAPAVPSASVASVTSSVDNLSNPVAPTVSSTTSAAAVPNTPVTTTPSPVVSPSRPLSSSQTSPRQNTTSPSRPLSSSQTSPRQNTTSPSPTGNDHLVPNNGRLENGTVVGIVVGVALGIALLTFLATFLIMRRKRASGGKLQRRDTRDLGTNGAIAGGRTPGEKSNGPVVTEARSDPAGFESYLPQSADDATVKNKAKTTLDQIELYIENFYQDAGASSPPSERDLTVFATPLLPGSLSSMLKQSRSPRPILKHALAHYITSSISPAAGSNSTLLPPQFTHVPSPAESLKSGARVKPGYDQSLSRWRVLTAYLQPDPSEDRSYMAQRAQQINEIVHTFSLAFGPWKNPKYSDGDRARSLSAILTEAADLGIWLFSQPCLLQFRWPRSGEISPGKIAVTPELVKSTDERGLGLREAQVMVEFVTQKL